MAYRFTASVYQPRQSGTRRDFRATLIENEPQVSVQQVVPRVRLKSSSPNLSESSSPDIDGKSNTNTPSTDMTSEASSLWSKRCSSSDYDSELYSLTDDETFEVPIMISNSVKKSAGKMVSRYPSLVIPSPSAWPMPPSAQKASACSIGLSPASKIALSPAQLATFQARNAQAPGSSCAPSLDGSLTSEELALSSCPSTPELQNPPDVGEWDAPMQLDPVAFATLHHLNPDLERNETSRPASEVSMERSREMQEISREPPIRTELVPGNDLSVRAQTPEADDPLSALTVPSPGGFFASLRGSARQTWCVGAPPLPSTSTAERFYGVPWQRSRGNSPERPSAPARPQMQRGASSQQTVTQLGEGVEIAEIIKSPTEYNQDYQDELRQSAVASFDKTKLWLNAQWTYLASLSVETPTDNLRSCFSPDTPDTVSTIGSLNDTTPSKKSVRFLETIPEKSEATLEPSVGRTEPIFFQGFQYVSSTMRSLDAFFHRQARAEANHVEANNLSPKHCSQLQGDFEVKTIDRPAPTRPISEILPEEPEDERKEVIAAAERERQVLEQIMPSAWELQAARHVFGSQLLTSPVVAKIRSMPHSNILDYGGQVACGWGWNVALQYRHATVYTVPQTAEASNTRLIGPSNHRVVTATQAWSLPFPNNHFDVISARSFYAMLRTSDPYGDEEDEYDLALQECMRVLKPGGYLEFNLLDAELLHPSAPGQALSVEFAFNLRTRGYDPCASKTFLSRLRKAGFEGIKRAWMVLPCADVTPRWVDHGKMTPLTPPNSTTPKADPSQASYFPVQKKMGPNGEVKVYEPPLTGSTTDVRAMTGLVGARAWERWIMKLQREMGGPEDKMMGRVSRALEEGGKGKAGWKCLMGWARKGDKE